MTHRMIFACLLSLALGACGATALPASQTASPLRAQRSFHEVDADSNAELTADELHTATSFFHSEFDRDGDAALSAEELAAGMFRAFDANGSGRVDPGELERGAMTWWPADADLGRVDADGDGYVDPDELDTRVRAARVFAAYDRDGDASVTDREVTLALFHSWDLDSSDTIDALEWRYE